MGFYGNLVGYKNEQDINNSITIAKNYANNALESATNAEDSVNKAQEYANNALESAQNAGDSVDKAQEYANNANASAVAASDCLNKIIEKISTSSNSTGTTDSNLSSRVAVLETKTSNLKVETGKDNTVANAINKAVSDEASRINNIVGTPDNGKTIQNEIDAVEVEIGNNTTSGTIKYRIQQLENNIGSGGTSDTTDINTKINSLDVSNNISSTVAGIAVTVNETDGKVLTPIVTVSDNIVTYTAKTSTAAAKLTVDNTANVIKGQAITAIKNYIDSKSNSMSITGTAGASRTLTSLSLSNGVISATFSSISITKSQISDFPTTMKNPYSLSIGGKTYDGSAAISISATDLGIGNSTEVVEYTHPEGSAPSQEIGFYKFSTDATSHISSVIAVTKADITALGIPAQDTTYSNATTSAAGLMSAADKTKLDNLSSGSSTTADWMEYISLKS